MIYHDAFVCIVDYIVAVVAAVLCVVVVVVAAGIIIVTVTRFQLFKSPCKRFHAGQLFIRAYLDQLLDYSI